MLHKNKPFCYIAKRAAHQCSILVHFDTFDWTTGFCWSYIHTLTLAARSYVLLYVAINVSQISCVDPCISLISGDNIGYPFCKFKPFDV